MLGASEVPVLPSRTRLFHIGPPKTGTTALQAVAAASRPALLANGVRYPGHRRNHQLAVAAFMGRGFGWATEDGRAAKPPSMRQWKALLDEIERDAERRIWLGHEYAAYSEDAMARRWMDTLGPRTHVVITLRPFSRMLPSMWQETLKGSATREPFDRWLRKALEPGTEANRKLRIRHDHSGLIRRWIGAAGLENVTVVVLDPQDRAFAYHSFEQLLGLPHGLLADAQVPEQAQNRSMSTAEIELVRRLNITARAGHIEWPNHEWLVYHGAVDRLLNSRTPGAGEGRLLLPEWAARIARAEEERYAEEIAATRVRVVGDLANIVEPVRFRSAPEDDHRNIDSIPIDVAVEALVGTIAAATGRNHTFVRTPRSVRRKLLTDIDNLRWGAAEVGPSAFVKGLRARTVVPLRALRHRSRKR